MNTTSSLNIPTTGARITARVRLLSIIRGIIVRPNIVGYVKLESLLGFVPPERPKRRQFPSNSDNFDQTIDSSKIPTSDLVTEVIIRMRSNFQSFEFQPLGVPIIVLSILFVFMCLMYSFGK